MNTTRIFILDSITHDLKLIIFDSIDFETGKSILVPLSDTFDILKKFDITKIKTEKLTENDFIITFNPCIFNMYNVMKENEDLAIFSDFNDVNCLAIYNDTKVRLSLSYFYILKLKDFCLKNVEISLTDVLAYNERMSVQIFGFENCRLLNDEKSFLNFSDVMFTSLTVKNCEIDETFFDWYDKMKNLRVLTFKNNKLLKKNRSETFCCCFSRKQYQLLIEKKSLHNLEIECTEHNFHFSYKITSNNKIPDFSFISCYDREPFFN